MLVTKLEPVTKTKYKVYLEEQFAFVLYKGELLRYKIQEGKELSSEVLDEIRQEILIKRAKKRTLHLLTHMDRTEEQLRARLRQDLYPEDIAEIAVQYVKSFGYIGDTDYARRFAESKKGIKSRMEIKMALLQRGVEKETVEQVLENVFAGQDEAAAIRKLLEKRGYSGQTATDAETKKIYGYLLRKGFRHEDIRQVIHVSSWNA